MKPPRLLLPALAALLAAAPRLSAQAAPAPSAAATADADQAIVQLNVFQVSAERDDEYRAANTTTGTRYNTPIKDLPMNIEVLTSAFMRDIGALDIRDALEYVSGIQLDTTAGGTGGTKDNPENTTLLIRGISAGMKKDGFARFVPMDPITMSPSTSSRAPAAPSTARTAPAASSTSPASSPAPAPSPASAPRSAPTASAAPNSSSPAL